MALTNLATAAPAAVNYQLMQGLLSTAKKKLPMFNGTVPGVLQMNQSAPAVIWERINNLAITGAMTALGERTTGSTRAFQNGRTPVVATVSTVTSTPLKYGAFIDMNEEVDLINMNLRSMNYMDTLGAQAGEVLNELMIDVYQTTTNNRFSSAVASAGLVGSSISLNDIKSAVNTLNRLDARSFESMGTGTDVTDTKTVREAYYGICHPDVEEDLRALGLIGVEQYAGYMQTLPGEIGTLNGVRFCTTTLAGLINASGGASANGMRFTASAGAIDVYSTFIYGQEAIGSVGLGQGHEDSINRMYEGTVKAVEVIQHPKGSAGAADPLNEFGTLGWKAWFSGVVLNDDWVVDVQTGASLLV